MPWSPRPLLLLPWPLLLLPWPLLSLGCTQISGSSPGAAFVDESVPRPAGLPASTQRRPSYAGTPTVLFLQLEGASISLGARSHAPSNQSYVCGGSFPPWDASPFGGSRAEVALRLRLDVQALFADFNLDVVTGRPATGDYDMIVVGGTASLCGRPDGIGGLGPLDCANADRSDVAFVFGATIIDLHGLAVSAAHEAGHTWGLPHTTEPCDVMSSSWCTGGDKRFRDQEMTVPPGPSGGCGLKTSNSWRRLREILGPRAAPVADAAFPAADSALQEASPRDHGKLLPETTVSPASGCTLAPEQGSLGAHSLVILGFLMMLLRWSRRAAVDAETAHGHSRRDHLGNR